MESPIASTAVDPERMEPAASKPVPDHLVTRLAVLSLMLGGAHYWAARHLGISLLEDWEKWPVAILIPWLLPGLEFFGGETAKTGLLGKVRNGLVFLIETPRLVLIAALLLLVGSIFSSVTVVPEGAPVPLEIVLRRQGPRAADGETNRLTDPSGPVRFHRWTNPFGTPVVLTVDGYKPHSFVLLPWVGAQVRVDRDLQPAPSVLVRVPIASHSGLATGRIELWSCGDATNLLAQQATSESVASVMFGWPRPVDAGLRADWEHDLRAAFQAATSSTPMEMEIEMSRAYLRWRHPEIVEVKAGLEAGQPLEARFVSKGGIIVARKRFVVTSEPLFDILLSKESNSAP